MKQYEMTDVTYTLTPQNMENVFNVYEDESSGLYFYNLLKTVNFPVDLDVNVYTEYTTKLNDTWPLVAWVHYRNVKLWWLICSVNQIMNPTIQPEPGTVLKILTVPVVKSLLGTLKK